MRTYIIYIPGLGDRYAGFRATVLKWWNLWGVTAIHVPVIWFDGGSLESKLQKVRAAIDTVPANSRIVLVGESAGATLALHSAAENSRVSGVITLCGVARPDTPVSGYLRRKAPALGHGVDSLTEGYGGEIHSVRAFIDGVVAKKFSVVKGSREHVIPSIGHISTIALCLTFLAPYIIRIATKRR